MKSFTEYEKNLTSVHEESILVFCIKILHEQEKEQNIQALYHNFVDHWITRTTTGTFKEKIQLHIWYFRELKEKIENSSGNESGKKAALTSLEKVRRETWDILKKSPEFNEKFQQALDEYREYSYKKSLEKDTELQKKEPSEVLEKFKSFILKASASSGSTTANFNENTSIDELKKRLNPEQLRIFKAQKKRESETFFKKGEDAKWKPSFIAAYENSRAIEDSISYLRARFKRYPLSLQKIPSIESRARIDTINKIIVTPSTFDWKDQKEASERKLYREYLPQDPRFMAIKELWLGMKDKLENFLAQESLPQEDKIIVTLCLDIITDEMIQFSNLLVDFKRYEDQRAHLSNQANSTYNQIIGIITTLLAEVLEKDPLREPSAEKLIPEEVFKAFPSISNVKYGKKGSEATCHALRALDLSSYINSKGTLPEVQSIGLPKIGCSSSGSSYCSTEMGAGYFEWSNKIFNPEQEEVNVLLLGRTSETTYNLSLKQIDGEPIQNILIDDILGWINETDDEESEPADPSPVKTLIFDITLCKPKEELWNVISSKDIKKQIEKGKLQIIVVSSDQKQQTLGTGKFSAGEYCVIAKKETVEKINSLDYSSSYNIDTKIAEFFRCYTQKSRNELMEKQEINAERLAIKIKELTGIRAIPNGPFVQLLIDLDQKEYHEAILKALTKSYSFGFVKSSYSLWDTSKIRINVGLENPADVIKTFETLLRPEAKSSLKT